MKKLWCIFILLLLGSCSRTTTINLKPKTFSATPKNVVWIQIPGFELEHAAMVRFASTESRNLLPIEDVDCIGSAWSYNYYDLRPDAVTSALSQITGSPDIKNNCAGEERYPAWQYYRTLGYETYAIESGVNKATSLLSHEQCTQGKFLDGLTLLTMQVAPTKKSENHFHYQSNKKLQINQVNWDQTCQKDNRCYATILNNIRSVWNDLNSSGRGVFLLVRNFEYLEHLKNGQVQLAREVLSEVDKVVSFIREQAGSEQTLILVTGAQTQSLRLPKRGAEWIEFEKKGKNVVLERSRLLSPVLASGPTSENFCGVYDDSRLLFRQFYRPEAPEFSLEKIIELGN